jgi:hypothetical protein
MGQILSEEGPKRQPFFWRQFEPARTRRQLGFDLVFGVIGPILCLVFDPIDRLRGIPFVPETSLDRLVTAYQREQDPNKKEVLKRFYKDATGKDIDHRRMIFYV